MFTLGQASSYNGSHATFPSQAVVGTVVQPLVISSGSYNPTNPPSKSLTINIQRCLYPPRRGIFFSSYMHNNGAIPQDAQRKPKKGLFPSTCFMFFTYLWKCSELFFFGIVSLSTKSILRTETVRFAEIRLQNHSMAV